MGAGVKGWGGLADGKLYQWKLIGTDPGGDLAIIQLEGKAVFPATPLGNSDEVKVGDWALAMGTPFILTEDQAPTVTLGIVSGGEAYINRGRGRINWFTGTVSKWIRRLILATRVAHCSISKVR